MLNTKRAQEILESKGVIEVFHRERPVWLEKLNGDMVNIQYLDSKKHTLVPVNELKEC